MNVELNLKNRTNLVTNVPLKPDFNEMLKEIEQEYPGFTVIEREFNPDRVRAMPLPGKAFGTVDHYEFYLERQ